MSIERDIFDHWRAQLEHPQALFTDERRRKIRARLNEGYSPDDLLRAIDGAREKPTIVQGKLYDALTLILRDGEHVEEYMRRATLRPSRGPVAAIPEHFRDALKQAAGEDTYGIWLDELEWHGVAEDGVLVLTAHAGIATWINERYASVLARVFGQPVEVFPR